MVIDQHLPPQEPQSKKEPSKKPQNSSPHTTTNSSTKPTKLASIIKEEVEDKDDPNSVENLVSNDVMEEELKNIQTQIDQFNQKKITVPEDLLDRQQSIQLKHQLLQVQVQTGQLSQEDYLNQLRTAIEKDKKLALQYKQKGDKSTALMLLRRAKIMENEIKESLQE